MKLLIFLGKMVAKAKLPRARVLSKIHPTIIIKKNETYSDQVIDSNIIVNVGAVLTLKNVTLNGDLENKGDVKTQGNVVFNGKVKTTNKIIAMKHKELH